MTFKAVMFAISTFILADKLGYLSFGFYNKSETLGEALYWAFLFMLFTVARGASVVWFIHFLIESP